MIRDDEAAQLAAEANDRAVKHSIKLVTDRVAELEQMLFAEQQMVNFLIGSAQTGQPIVDVLLAARASVEITQPQTQKQTSLKAAELERIDYLLLASRMISDRAKVNRRLN